MDLPEEQYLWKSALGRRKFQHFFGTISALFFALALLSLFDGLQAKMRTGPQELDLLPGEELLISGPCPVKNPVSGDLLVRWSPRDAPLSFELEGFYTGYWFGSGMWRGRLLTGNDAESGTYSLYISFRGASAKTLQSFTVNLYKNKAERQGASRSIINFLIAVNPFILAALLGALALAAAILTYLYGMSYGAALGALGMAEIYRLDKTANLAWCLVSKKNVPPPGTSCPLVTPEGKFVGLVRAGSWDKGKLSLIPDSFTQISTNDLVCLNNRPCSIFK